MRKIVLQKNLEMSGVFYPEGAEVEVDEATYKYLINSYLESRKELLEEVKSNDELIEKVSKVRSKVKEDK